MPNFSHGTAGIAFTLATLAEAIGDDHLLAAALDGARYLTSIARADDGGCAVCHDEGQDPPEFTLGWCHGPPGLGALFSVLGRVTTAPGWELWAERCVRTLRTSDIPERRTPGFWDNVARCCGSAGVADFLLDRYIATGDPDTLAFTLTIVDDLLDRAVIDERGMRWSNFEWRADPPELAAETGFMQGASGIGALLLRLGTLLDGKEITLAYPWSAYRPSVPSAVVCSHSCQVT